MRAPLAPIYVYPQHLEVKQAICSLQYAGFDLAQLSLLVVKGYDLVTQAQDTFTSGEYAQLWKSSGTSWGGIWGLLSAPAVISVPGMGLMAVAGPMARTLADRASGLVPALAQLGIAHADVGTYEAALRTDQFLLCVHGSVIDRINAQRVLHPGTGS